MLFPPSGINHYGMILFLTLFYSSLSAQAVYSVSGPCSTEDDPESRSLLPVLDDWLPIREKIGDTTFLRLTQAQPDLPLITLLKTTGSISYLRGDSASQQYRIDQEVFELRAGAEEVLPLLTLERSPTFAGYWKDDLYYYAQTPNRRAGVYRHVAGPANDVLLWEGEGNNRASLFGRLDDYFVFVNNNTFEYRTLLRSDGTPEGTVVIDTLFDIRGNSNVYSSYSRTSWRSDGQRGWFYYGRPFSNEQVVLFTTEGTPGSTRALAKFDWSPFSSFPAGKILDGIYVFANRPLGAPSGFTVDIYRSDGTEEGTYSINPFSSTEYANPTQILVYRDSIWYIPNFGGSSNDVYRTDGTKEGNVRVPLTSTFTDNPFDFVVEMAVFKDSLLLSASPDFRNTELYITKDGTAATTRRIADINPGRLGSSPRRFRVGDRKVFFQTTNSSFPEQTYVWDLDREEPPTVIFSVDSLTTTTASSQEAGTLTVFATGNGLEYRLDTLTNTTGRFTDLPAGEYTLTVTSMEGCSDVRQVTIDQNTSLINRVPATQQDYLLYPNPVTSGQALRLRAEPGAAPVASIRAYDMTGRLLRQYAGSVPVLRLPNERQQLMIMGLDRAGRPLFRQLVTVR